MPEVLLQGDHARVERWRRKQQFRRTREKRPDLYEKLELTDPEDRKLLQELEKEAARTPLTEPLSCRPATEEDLPALMEIVRDAQASLKKHRVDQWQDGYPREENFRFDMERGECFVLLHGEEIAGFFTLSTREEESYAAITDGKWTEGMAYCVLHRAAVAQKYRGSGMAAYLMKCVEAAGPGIWTSVHPHGYPQEEQAHADPPAGGRLPLPGQHQRPGERGPRPGETGI